jgi:glycosyltransferase involved in cell wall biosynthesis
LKAKLIMRILSITAGAGGMYCGSCLRDNALAAELLSQGQEVLLVPLYTPLLTDEPNVSQKKVLFGGISVYLQQYVPFFRKTPWWLDRLWDSSFVIRLATRFSVSTDPGNLGDLTVSVLQGEDGAQRKELHKLLDWLVHQPRPDIVSLPNSLLIGLARPIKEALNRPICCTLQGEDLFLEGLYEPYRQQALELIRKNVQWVDGFIAVSEYYARFMSDMLRIPSEKMNVAPLGINLEGYRPQPSADRKPFTVGYFARIAPEKGLHNLCEAYRQLRHQDELPPSRLEVAGYLPSDHRGYLRKIEGQMNQWDLGDEFHYHGSLGRREKIDFLGRLDVLSVPSSYKEPKGICLLEAMACGTPVVQPRHGAFPEVIEKTGGGILVEPDDAKALAEGIASIAKEPGLARELGRKAAEGIRAHYGASQMALRTLAVYTDINQSAAKEGAVA